MFVEPVLSNVCGTNDLFANLEQVKIDSYFANNEGISIE